MYWHLVPQYKFRLPLSMPVLSDGLASALPRCPFHRLSHMELLHSFLRSWSVVPARMLSQVLLPFPALHPSDFLKLTHLLYERSKGCQMVFPLLRKSSLLACLHGICAEPVYCLGWKCYQPAITNDSVCFAMILSSMASKFSFSISVFIIFIIPRYENIATKETILTTFVIFLPMVFSHS